MANVVLEEASAVASQLWKASTNAVLLGPVTYHVEVPDPVGHAFYRLRLVE